jgi:threonyl-tRNA synthetase
MNQLETSSLKSIRRSAAELLAKAICELFPTVQLVQASDHEWGFYCDVVLDKPFDVHFLTLLEESMRGAIKKGLPIESLSMMRENAVSVLQHRKQDLLAEIAGSARLNILQMCRIGEFYDYCPDPHEFSSIDEGVIKLCEATPLEVFNPALGELTVLRIEGTAFSDSQQLKQFLKKREKAKEFNHLLIGKECKFFDFFPDISLSPWLWLPKGAFAREALLNFWRDMHKDQFQIISTPLLWQEEFLKNEKTIAAIQTENTPIFDHAGLSFALISPTIRSYFHAWCYRSEEHLACQLPIRYAECSEGLIDCLPGQELGLLRTPNVTSDISHFFCSKEQLYNELISSLHFIEKIISIVAFEWRCYLVSTEKKRKIGAVWQESEVALENALKEKGIAFEKEISADQLDGPKVEFALCDSLGREWRGPSLQVNCEIPKRLGLSYRDNIGIGRPVVMIARTLFGTIESFLALLIEQKKGELPLWITPEQVRVIAAKNEQQTYAEEIYRALRQAGIRAGISFGKSSLATEVRQAEKEMIPYTIIVGAREKNTGNVAVRRNGNRADSFPMTLETFLSKLEGEIAEESEKRNNLMQELLN